MTGATARTRGDCVRAQVFPSVVPVEPFPQSTPGRVTTRGGWEIVVMSARGARDVQSGQASRVENEPNVVDPALSDAIELCDQDRALRASILV